jgi:hypothetical protein
MRFGRSGELAAVLCAGIVVGLLVDNVIFPDRSVREAGSAETEQLAAQATMMTPCHRRAKAMDPPVLPRIFNALNIGISEGNLQRTLDLLIDTPDATVSAADTAECS